MISNLLREFLREVKKGNEISFWHDDRRAYIKYINNGVYQIDFYENSETNKKEDSIYMNDSCLQDYIIAQLIREIKNERNI